MSKLATYEGQKEISEKLGGLVTEQTAQTIANHLGLIALAHMENTMNVTTDFQEMGKIVARGYGPDVYAIGDQITVPWRDGNNEYSAVFDVVHHGTVELEGGRTAPGMFLQWHYASPFGVQFDAAEAFWKVKENPLPAGTYNVTMGFKWGNNVVQNKTYQFTLTQEVPEGGILTGFTGAPDQAATNWKVTSWASNTATDQIETVPVSEGSEGESLGTFTAAGDENLNSLYRVAYGYNRWPQSGLRQYLNSNAAAGAWWKPQNDFDKAPAELATHPGFMAGFDPEFLEILGAIKVATARNYVDYDSIGTNNTPIFENTYDKFFVPSLEQIYANPQTAGEGEYWEYYKRTLGTEAPVAQYGTYPRLIKYALNAKTSAQIVRLRSANRGGGGNAWSVGASGSVYNGIASGAHRFAPACCVIGK